MNTGKKSAGLFAATSATAGMNVVAGILVARALGAEAVGALALSLGLSGVLLAALVPGFVQAHMKRVADGQDVSRCIATFAVVKLVVYALLAALVVAAGPWRHHLFETGALETVFVLLFAGALASNFAEVFTVALLARELAGARALVMLVSRAVRVVATVVVLVVAPDVRWVAATFALEGLVELTGAAVLARARLGARLAAPTAESLRGYWEYARPLLVTVPIGMLQDSIDRVVVARWAGLAAGGHYHVARGLWEVLGAILAPPTTFLFVRLSALFAERTPERLREAREVFASAFDKVLFVTVPVALALWFGARPALELLYGEGFGEAETAVRVFVLAGVAAAIVNPYTRVVYALDAHARFVPVALLRGALYLSLLAVVVPVAPIVAIVPALGLGETGGALARLFAILFPAWVYVRWTRALAGLGFDPRAVVYAGGFTVAVLVFHAVTAVAGPGAAAAVAGAVLGAAAYAVWLRAFHPASLETLAYCLDVVSPLRLGRRATRP